MSADERLLAELTDLSNRRTLIDMELKTFIVVMLSDNKLKQSLEFWTTHGSSMQILLRIIRRVFPISPCSTDVERFFSITGCICADHRGRLNPAMVNVLASMNSWLRREYVSKRNKPPLRLVHVSLP